MPTLHPPFSMARVEVSAQSAGRYLSQGWRPADVPEPPDTPPRAGRGSSRKAWEHHAAVLGVPVEDRMSRDDIIAAVEGK